jgi:hypothetical protein
VVLCARKKPEDRLSLFHIKRDTTPVKLLRALSRARGTATVLLTFGSAAVGGDVRADDDSWHRFGTTFTNDAMRDVQIAEMVGRPGLEPGTD